MSFTYANPEKGGARRRGKEHMVFYDQGLKELLSELEGKTTKEAYPIYIVKDLPRGLFGPTEFHEKQLRKLLSEKYERVRQHVGERETYPNYVI